VSGQLTLDSGTDQVLTSVADGVATITLNRPERRNAFSPELLSGLATALAAAQASDQVGAVVLTGAGGAFCAGGDVKGFSESNKSSPGTEVDPARIDEMLQSQRRTVGLIHQFDKPVIASLPGAAAGAGLGIALAADLRIGCPKTLMTTAFATVGLSGDYGTIWFLTRLVGPSRARELMFLAERLDSEACLRLGLINRLVAEADLEVETHQLAARLANGPQFAIRAIKRNLLQAESSDLDAAMAFEVPLLLACRLTPDFREAVDAFMAKRPAQFDAAWH
jgi:2-(1,2-epoxy-1,2-dihydrophenyl)acetyl-CoA isomerase